MPPFANLTQFFDKDAPGADSTLVHPVSGLDPRLVEPAPAAPAPLPFEADAVQMQAAQPASSPIAFANHPTARIVPAAIAVPMDRGPRGVIPGPRPASPEVEAMFLRVETALGKRIDSTPKSGCRRFSDWLEQQGRTLTTMQPSDLDTYLHAKYDKPGSRNAVGAQVRRLFDVMRSVGEVIPPVDWRHEAVPVNKQKDAERQAKKRADERAAAGLPPTPRDIPVLQAEAVAAAEAAQAEAEAAERRSEAGRRAAATRLAGQSAEAAAQDAAAQIAQAIEAFPINLEPISSQEQPMTVPPVSQPVVIPPARPAAPQVAIPAPVNVPAQPQQVIYQPQPPARRTAHPATIAAAQTQQQIQAVMPTETRFLIRMRAPGGMPGTAPGSLIEIGRYPIKYVQLDNDVRTFIEVNVHPQYKHFATESRSPVLTYVVEAIDASGKLTGQIVEYTFAVPFDAAAQNMAPAMHPQMQMPAPAAGPSDRFLEMIMGQMNALLSKATAPVTGQEDYRQMIERMEAKHELERLRDQYERRMRELEERERMGGGMNGINGLMNQMQPAAPIIMPPAAPAPVDSTIGDIAKMLLEKTLTPPAPPPPPPPAPADPFSHPVVAKLLELQLMDRSKPQSDPLVQYMLEQAKEDKRRLESQLAEATKPKPSEGISSTIAAVKEITDVAEQLGMSRGGGGSVGMGEILGMVAENLPAIFEGVGKMFAARAAPQAFVAAAAGQPVQGQMNGVAPQTGNGAASQVNGAAAKPAAAQQLPEVIELIKGMVASGNETETAAMLEQIVVTYVNTPGYEAWGEQIIGQLADCDSRPEVRSLVTRLLKMSGDKMLAADEGAIERITQALVNHYSTLIKDFTGNDKTLVLPQTAAPAAAAAAAAPVQAPAAAAPVNGVAAQPAAASAPAAAQPSAEEDAAAQKLDADVAAFIKEVGVDPAVWCEEVDVEDASTLPEMLKPARNDTRRLAALDARAHELAEAMADAFGDEDEDGENGEEGDASTAVQPASEQIIDVAPQTAPQTAAQG